MTLARRMTPLERLLEAVDQLTQPRSHGEPYTRLVRGTWITERWETHSPSLLDQLAHALPGGSTDSGHSIPDSRPQAHLDALDTLLEIDTECAQLLDLHKVPQRATVAANVRALIGLTLNAAELSDVAGMAWGWRTRAAVITGWEMPAKQLDNTCPLCAHRGGLRVRVDVGTGTGTGFCVACRETWDEDSLWRLAWHVRQENDELEEVAS